MGAQPVFIPPFNEPFAKVPYRQATWPSAARKVYACLMFYCYLWRIKDGRITIPDRFGAQWCSRHFDGDPYGSTGQRCWQKGLKQLEKLGVISRQLGRGRRVIVINVKHPDPKPKTTPRPKPKPTQAQPKAPEQAKAPETAPATTPTPAQGPKLAEMPRDDAPLDPETQATWNRFRARARAASDKAKPRPDAEQADAEMQRRRAEAAKRFGTDQQLQDPPARE
jgi:hypothetical protein